MRIQDTDLLSIEDEKDGGSPMTLEFDRICIDFVSAQNAWKKQFLEFAERYEDLLGLEDEDEEIDLLEAYLERVWPADLPGTAIIANTRPFNDYLLRPPVDGPLAATFAAGSVAPAFALQERVNGLYVVGFSVTPHLEPRWFERTISGLFVRSWRPFQVRLPMNPAMSAEDLKVLRELPPHRQITDQRLQGWRQYLDWKTQLVHRDQISLRYEEWQLRDARLLFRVRGEVKGQLQGKALAAFATAESASPDRWEQKGKRAPRGIELGEIIEVRRLRGREGEPPATLVAIDPIEELLDQLESAEDPQARRKMLPDDGFLLSAIYGDLAPLENQRRGIERLRDGRTFAPRLADYLFDISMALVPEPGQPQLELPPAERLNSRLNEDQLRAVRGALSAQDFYLIQGPPGTGKTTVIAELCYQVARRGGRVLVASQTNLAVDNALARLGNRPNMRPLRLGDEKRVGDEFKEFLQRNVVERWFRGIGAECERRWAAGNAMKERRQEARNAIADLRAQLASFEDQADALQRLAQRQTSVRDAQAAQRTRAKAQAEAASSAQAQAGALESAVKWLIEAGPRPTEASIAQTQWAKSLINEVARFPAAPPFAGAPFFDVSIGQDLASVLARVDAMMRAIDGLDALATAAAPVQAASRAHRSGASGEADQKLQELLALRQRLADSEDEQEASQLALVNRQIKRLRGQHWTEVCRALMAAIGKVFHPAPPALEQLASSLEPRPEHVERMEQLTSWIDAARSWGGEITVLLGKSSAAAAKEAAARRSDAEKARQDANEAHAQADALEPELVSIDADIANHARVMGALRPPCAALAGFPMTSILLGKSGSSRSRWRDSFERFRAMACSCLALLRASRRFRQHSGIER